MAYYTTLSGNFSGVSNGALELESRITEVSALIIHAIKHIIRQNNRNDGHGITNIDKRFWRRIFILPFSFCSSVRCLFLQRCI